MLIKRWIPWDALDPVGRELESAFGEIFGGADSLVGRGRTVPAMNLREEADRFIAEIDAPGFAMGELDVEVFGDRLTVKGRRSVEEKTDETFLRRERRLDEFARTMTLPAEVDGAKVEALLKDGVLTITLPKAETARVRKIEVKNVE